MFRAPRQVKLLAELPAGVALHATDRGWWHCGESGLPCPPDWRLNEWTGTYTAAEALPAGTTLRASDFEPPLQQQNVSCQDIGVGYPKLTQIDKFAVATVVTHH